MALSLRNSWGPWLARLNPTALPRRQRQTSITALDLEADCLDVVQAALRGGRPQVVRQATVPLDRPPDAGPDDPAGLGKAVAAALTRVAISPGPVVMGVPRAQVLLRTLELPPADREAEIAAMVHLRLSRDLPFPLDEAWVDFQVLSRPPAASPDRANPPAPGTPTRVLAAVVRRKTVEYYQSLAKAAGVKLVALGLRSLAAAHAAVCGHPEAASGCVALVSVHPLEVVLDVLIEGALVFSRVGALPATPAAEPAVGAGSRPRPTGGAGDAAVLEVIRSLHSYEASEGHVPVTRLLVAGATGAETDLADALARQLGVPATVVQPVTGSSERSAAGEPPLPALPAIGLALGALEASGLPFDFLHPKRPPVVRDHRRVRQLGLAAGVLAVLLTAVGLRARWIGERARLRTDLQEQVTLVSKNLAAYRLVRNQARTLKEWSAAGRNWLDHLTVLSALLPPSRELYVTALSTSARNTLNLSVKIRRGETVDRLTATLRTAGYDVKAPAIMPATDRFGFRFQANLELEVPATITNDLDGLVVESRGPTPAPAAAPAPASSPASAPTPPAADASPAPSAAAAAAPSVEAGQPDTQNRTPRIRRRRPEGGGRE